MKHFKKIILSSLVVAGVSTPLTIYINNNIEEVKQQVEEVPIYLIKNISSNKDDQYMFRIIEASTDVSSTGNTTITITQDDVVIATQVSNLTSGTTKTEYLDVDLTSDITFTFEGTNGEDGLPFVSVLVINPHEDETIVDASTEFNFENLNISNETIEGHNDGAIHFEGHIHDVSSIIDGNVTADIVYSSTNEVYYSSVTSNLQFDVTADALPPGNYSIIFTGIDSRTSKTTVFDSIVGIDILEGAEVPEDPPIPPASIMFSSIYATEDSIIGGVYGNNIVDNSETIQYMLPSDSDWTDLDASEDGTNIFTIEGLEADTAYEVIVRLKEDGTEFKRFVTTDDSYHSYIKNLSLVEQSHDSISVSIDYIHEEMVESSDTVSWEIYNYFNEGIILESGVVLANENIETTITLEELTPYTIIAEYDNNGISIERTFVTYTDPEAPTPIDPSASIYAGREENRIDYSVELLGYTSSEALIPGTITIAEIDLVNKKTGHVEMWNVLDVMTNNVGAFVLDDGLNPEDFTIVLNIKYINEDQAYDEMLLEDMNITTDGNVGVSTQTEFTISNPPTSSIWDWMMWVIIASSIVGTLLLVWLFFKTETGRKYTKHRRIRDFEKNG